MSLMRFGALLATPDGRLAFYLSHRVFLTVRGVRASAPSPQLTSTRRVFARNAIAVSLFEAMIAVTHSRRRRTTLRPHPTGTAPAERGHASRCRTSHATLLWRHLN